LIDVRDMRLLVALDHQKHFSRAADQVGVSQPAFSARLRSIEETLNLSIVRRANKFIGFTAEGEILLKWARSILADVDAMQQEIEMTQGGLRGNLVIGAVPTALPFAADATAKLRKRHPDLTLEIQSLSSTRIARGVADYTLDAGITYLDPDHTHDFDFHPLYDEHYILIAPAALVDNHATQITWADAAKLPLCLLSKDMRNRAFIDEAFEAVGAHPIPVMETNAFTAALALVASGTAATIAPAGLAASVFAGENSVRLPLVDPISAHSIGIVSVAQSNPRPAINELRSVLAQIVDEVS
jgi:DNA-binding transcriptional LysR family regulator